MALVPYVIEQSSRGERSFDIYSRLLEDRIVMLNEEVNSASASVVVAQLLDQQHEHDVTVEPKPVNCVVSPIPHEEECEQQ